MGQRRRRVELRRAGLDLAAGCGGGGSLGAPAAASRFDSNLLTAGADAAGRPALRAFGGAAPAALAEPAAAVGLPG